MSARGGIIGYPLGHSVSPAMHAAALATLGIDAVYEAWPTPAPDLKARVDSLRAADVFGANVTIPHKSAIIPMLDAIDPQAAAIGAVNTVVNRAGTLTGHNTDAPGFLRGLADDAGFEPAGRRFLLLGAGGAARGIAFALAGAGAAGITITNRTLEKAETLAEAVAGACNVRAAAAEQPGQLGGYHCIVNTTSLGMAGEQAGALPCQLATADRGTLIVDIVYNPERTLWLSQAEGLGLPVLGGLPMLVYQGAAAFDLWFGQVPPAEAMFEAARAALAGSH